MPRNEDWDDDAEFDYGSLPLEQQQEFLYDLIGFAGTTHDYEARSYFWDLMYNDELTSDQRLDIYEEFSQYLWDEYGLQFEDVWDWDAFREWYETA